MEWIGTGFVLTIGGVRLRVRIALEDTPDPCRSARDASAAAAAWDDDPPASRPRPRAADNASSMN